MRAADAKRCGTPAPRVRDAGGAGAGAEGCGRPTPRGAAVGVGAILVPEIPRVEVRDPSRPLWRARPVAQRSSSAYAERPDPSRPLCAAPPCDAAQLRTRRTAPSTKPLCAAPPCEAAQLRTPRTPSSLGPLCRAPPCDAAQRPYRTDPARHALLGILPDMRDIRRPTQDGRARGANVGESRCAENRSTGAGGRQSAPSSPPEHALVDTAPDIPDNSPPNACGTPRRPT